MDPLPFLQQSNLDAHIRKFDWTGLQATDIYARSDYASISASLNTTETSLEQWVQTFDFGPFGSAEPGMADGGQIFVRDPDNTIRISETRDGGKPYDQYFVGPGLWSWKYFRLGTGWIVWRDDISTEPKATVALLAISKDPNANPSLTKALTRYWRGTASFPVFEHDPLSLDLVVSEHYDASTIGDSRNMERTYFGAGYGPVAWQAWSRTARIRPDIGIYPPLPWGDTPYNDGMYLADCRLYTRFTILDQPYDPHTFSWPS